MKSQISQYCLRMSRSDYLEALDMAFVFGLSMNQFLIGAIKQYVQSQHAQAAVLCAVTKLREVREAGLSRAFIAALPEAAVAEAGPGSTEPFQGGLACELEMVGLPAFSK